MKLSGFFFGIIDWLRPSEVTTTVIVFAPKARASVTRYDSGVVVGNHHTEATEVTRYQAWASVEGM